MIEDTWLKIKGALGEIEHYVQRHFNAALDLWKAAQYTWFHPITELKMSLRGKKESAPQEIIGSVNANKSL